MIQNVLAVRNNQQSGNVATMTSLELVDFINTLRRQDGETAVLTHANFLKKVKEVFQGDEVKFYSIYKDTLNREKPMYRFHKREATLMAMSYSNKISAQVYDRMEELERQVKGTFQVPQSFHQALLLAAEQQKQIEEQQLRLESQQQQLTIAAPKVKFHDTFVERGDTYTATAIAKKLGVSAYTLNNWLVTKGALYRNKKHLSHWYIEKGYGVEKFVQGGTYAGVFQHSYHTSAGADWILANFDINDIRKNV